MITIRPRDYLTIPHLRGGRDRAAGVDCWGLYRLIVRDVTGVDLGEHGEVVDSLSIARELAAARRGSAWRRITEGDERPTDLVLMSGLDRDGHGRLHSVPLHVGCVIEPGLMIDSEEITGVMVRAYRDTPRRAALPTLVTRYLGVWRHPIVEAAL